MNWPVSVVISIQILWGEAWQFGGKGSPLPGVKRTIVSSERTRQGDFVKRLVYCHREVCSSIVGDITRQFMISDCCEQMQNRSNYLGAPLSLVPSVTLGYFFMLTK